MEGVYAEIILGMRIPSSCPGARGYLPGIFKEWGEGMGRSEGEREGEVKGEGEENCSEI